MTRNGKELEAGALFGTELLEPVSAISNDRRDVRDGFDIVNDRRRRIEASNGRERWLQSWLTATTLKRIEKGCFFTANVRTSASMNDQIKVKARTLNVLSQ